jgi:hypothetical protein
LTCIDLVRFSSGPMISKHYDEAMNPSHRTIALT